MERLLVGYWYKKGKYINMKKKILALLLVGGMMATMLTGCGDNREYLNAEIDGLKDEISELENQRDLLKSEIVDIKVENGTAKYIVTFNIKQNHLTLDLSEHMKDEMNDISIQIPVDKDYYDSVNIGDTITDDFRMGSLIMKGSFGNWDITVENKEIQ